MDHRYQAFPDAHFATFPRKLVEPCILAGTSQSGHCPECGARWVRITDTQYVKSPVHGDGSVVGRHYENGSNAWDGGGYKRLNKEVTTTGWRPGCAHNLDPIPDIVLDPFAGSGTVGQVAENLGRKYILIDLNSDYEKMQQRRTAQMGMAFVMSICRFIVLTRNLQSKIPCLARSSAQKARRLPR